ncbi:MAG: hypothetical protein DWQ07_16405 [Chloroflexi bacterium]|nr:MAG: hypothetical protein DWQ07_16405 [Chloroflexota bacterium]MBL1195335.1 hypothetical protein [Chloroflexota bacterium]NOH12619.1 hypothetical protein [Chloroflexota bacterium]
MGNLTDQPYKPSLIDRFTRWVANLPIRAWVFYVGFTLILVIVQLIFIWLDDGLQAVEILPVVVFNSFATPFLLALIHLLDDQAITALDSMKPALAMKKSQIKDYCYMLSTMPARAALIAGLAMLSVVILIELASPQLLRYAPLEQLPVFAIVFQIIDKSSAFLFGVFFYHTIRQLLLVNAINSKHVRISLFNTVPLQAFSRLTASTAVGPAVLIYVWLLINPELLTNPISIGFSGAVTVLAVAVFVWPLLGMHRRMQAEKESMLHALDLEFETIFSKFNQGLQDDDQKSIERLNGTIASLEIQRNRISAIPTWPWRPETARFALSAVALPLILSVLRFLVERAFS